jgi:hypothetical protein
MKHNNKGRYIWCISMFLSELEIILKVLKIFTEKSYLLRFFCNAGIVLTHSKLHTNLKHFISEHFEISENTKCENLKGEKYFATYFNMTNKHCKGSLSFAYFVFFCRLNLIKNA